MTSLNLDNLTIFSSDKQTFGKYSIEAQTAKSGGNHHQNRTFYIRENGNWSMNFSVMSSPAGCGSCILYNTCSGVSLDNFNEDFEAIINKIFEKYKIDGVGSMVTMFGQDYYNAAIYKIFMKLGFTVLSEYSNYRHGSHGNYKQQLLQLVL